MISQRAQTLTILPKVKLLQQIYFSTKVKIKMAPKGKKGDAALDKVLFGRPSNNLKMGVVGLPNVGKSTFFNALTNSEAAAENYPFCTIDPEESRVPLPDSRFDWLCQTYKPASKIPAYLTVIDIAGLVKGASTGAGLGNAFLSHIKAVDGMFYMSRCFEDADVTHVEGEVDPVRDMDIIHSELRLKDAEFVGAKQEAFEKEVKRMGSKVEKSKQVELDTLTKALKALKEDQKDIRTLEWSNTEIEILNDLYLLTAKPVVYLINLSEKDYVRKKNKWLPKIKQWIDENNPGSAIVPLSVCMETHLTTLQSAKEREDYLKGLGDNVSSVLPKIITQGYAALNLINYFTCGEDEVRAWTIRKYTKAPQAAGVIHTDFMRCFISADVMKYSDLEEAGSEASVKSLGKQMKKGKDYVVEDGNVIFFHHNARK